MRVASVTCSEERPTAIRPAPSRSRSATTTYGSSSPFTRTPRTEPGVVRSGVVTGSWSVATTRPSSETICTITSLRPETTACAGCSPSWSCACTDATSCLAEVTSPCSSALRSEVTKMHGADRRDHQRDQQRGRGDPDPDRARA